MPREPNQLTSRTVYSLHCSLFVELKSGTIALHTDLIGCTPGVPPARGGSCPGQTDRMARLRAPSAHLARGVPLPESQRPTGFATCGACSYSSLLAFVLPSSLRGEISFLCREGRLWRRVGEGA